MGESIQASVGRCSPNRKPDVTTIQRMLNRVPDESGGPAVNLDVDSYCGPQTKDAITRFQVKQFGWSGADGRVQPNRQTWHRLKTFSPATPVPPPKPSKPKVPPPKRPLHKSTRFAIIQPGHPQDILDREHEFFFRLILRDQPNNPRIYWLGRKDGYKRLRQKVKFTRDNWARKIDFDVPPPAVALTELDCEGNYLMYGRPVKKGDHYLFSKLILILGPGSRSVDIPMYRPLSPSDSHGKTSDGRPVFARRGWFQHVRDPRPYVDDEVWDLPEIDW